MCKVHLCEPFLLKMVVVGPDSLMLIPEEKYDHLTRCEECTGKLAEFIVNFEMILAVKPGEEILAVPEVTPRKVM